MISVTNTNNNTNDNDDGADHEEEEEDKYDKYENIASRRKRRNRRALITIATVFLLVMTWKRELSESVHRIIDSDGDDFNKSRGGWMKYKSSFDSDECTVDRVSLGLLTVEMFQKNYRLKRPCVVTDLNSTAFRANFATREKILRDHGEKTITLSSANTNSYEKKEKKLRAYVEENLKAMHPSIAEKNAAKIFYWFGDNKHEEFGEFFPEYARNSKESGIGKYIPEDSSVALSFGIGGPLSGVPMHVHGPGWSETIYGRKKWFLSPPLFEPIFNGNETTMTWVKQLQKRGNKGLYKKSIIIGKNGGGAIIDVDKFGNEKKITSCVVNENEAIYFPDHWYHATLNLDETVFMSSFVNYAS